MNLAQTAATSPMVPMSEDNRPIRTLAAECILRALEDLRGTRRYERVMARRFLTRRDPRPVPMNLAFCCEVLDLDVDVVRSRIDKLDPLALQALSNRERRRRR